MPGIRKGGMKNIRKVFVRKALDGGVIGVGHRMRQTPQGSEREPEDPYVSVVGIAPGHQFPSRVPSRTNFIAPNGNLTTSTCPAIKCMQMHYGGHLQAPNPTSMRLVSNLNKYVAPDTVGDVSVYNENQSIKRSKLVQHDVISRRGMSLKAKQFTTNSKSVQTTNSNDAPEIESCLKRVYSGEMKSIPRQKLKVDASTCISETLNNITSMPSLRPPLATASSSLTRQLQKSSLYPSGWSIGNLIKAEAQTSYTSLNRISIMRRAGRYKSPGIRPTSLEVEPSSLVKNRNGNFINNDEIICLLSSKDTRLKGMPKKKVGAKVLKKDIPIDADIESKLERLLKLASSSAKRKRLKKSTRKHLNHVKRIRLKSDVSSRLKESSSSSSGELFNVGGQDCCCSDEEVSAQSDDDNYESGGASSFDGKVELECDKIVVCCNYSGNKGRLRVECCNKSQGNRKKKRNPLPIDEDDEMSHTEHNGFDKEEEKEDVRDYRKAARATPSRKQSNESTKDRVEMRDRSDNYSKKKPPEQRSQERYDDTDNRGNMQSNNRSKRNPLPSDRKQKVPVDDYNSDSGRYDNHAQKSVFHDYAEQFDCQAQCKYPSSWKMTCEPDVLSNCICCPYRKCATKEKYSKPKISDTELHDARMINIERISLPPGVHPRNEARKHSNAAKSNETHSNNRGPLDDGRNRRNLAKNNVDRNERSPKRAENNKKGSRYANNDDSDFSNENLTKKRNNLNDRISKRGVRYDKSSRHADSETDELKSNGNRKKNDSNSRERSSKRVSGRTNNEYSESDESNGNRKKNNSNSQERSSKRVTGRANNEYSESDELKSNGNRKKNNSNSQERSSKRVSGRANNEDSESDDFKTNGNRKKNDSNSKERSSKRVSGRANNDYSESDDDVNDKKNKSSSKGRSAKRAGYKNDVDSEFEEKKAMKRGSNSIDRGPKRDASYDSSSRYSRSSDCTCTCDCEEYKHNKKSTNNKSHFNENYYQHDFKANGFEDTRKFNRNRDSNWKEERLNSTFDLNTCFCQCPHPDFNDPFVAWSGQHHQNQRYGQYDADNYCNSLYSDINSVLNAYNSSGNRHGNDLKKTKSNDDGDCCECCECCECENLNPSFDSDDDIYKEADEKVRSKEKPKSHSPKVEEKTIDKPKSSLNKRDPPRKTELKQSREEHKRMPVKKANEDPPKTPNETPKTISDRPIKKTNKIPEKDDGKKQTGKNDIPNRSPNQHVEHHSVPKPAAPNTNKNNEEPPKRNYVPSKNIQDNIPPQRNNIRKTNEDPPSSTNKNPNKIPRRAPQLEQSKPKSPEPPPTATSPPTRPQKHSQMDHSKKPRTVEIAQSEICCNKSNCAYRTSSNYSQSGPSTDYKPSKGSFNNDVGNLNKHKSPNSVKPDSRARNTIDCDDTTCEWKKPGARKEKNLKGGHNDIKVIYNSSSKFSRSERSSNSSSVPREKVLKHNKALAEYKYSDSGRRTVRHAEDEKHNGNTPIRKCGNNSEYAPPNTSDKKVKYTDESKRSPPKNMLKSACTNSRSNERNHGGGKINCRNFDYPKALVANQGNSEHKFYKQTRVSN